MVVYIVTQDFIFIVYEYQENNEWYYDGSSMYMVYLYM